MFSKITSAAAKLNDTIIAKSLLNEVLTAATIIKKSRDKASAFSGIVSVAAKFNDTALAKSLLNEVLTAAKTIEEPDSIAKVFGSIANSYIQLKDPASAKPILQQAWELAAPTKSSETLSSIAITYARLGDWGRAIQIAQDCEAQDKIRVLSKILTLHAEQQNPALVKLREAEEREEGDGF